MTTTVMLRRYFLKVSLNSIVLINKPNKKRNCSNVLIRQKKIVYCKDGLSNKSQKNKKIVENESL